MHWTSRPDVNAKLRKKAFGLWLSCHTQEEIAEAIGYSRPHVTEFLTNSGLVGNGKDAASDKTVDSAEDADDESNGLGRFTLTNEEIATSKHDVAFNAPIYNVWKWKEKTAGAEHFGNSEPTLVDDVWQDDMMSFCLVSPQFAEIAFHASMLEPVPRAGGAMYCRRIRWRRWRFNNGNDFRCSGLTQQLSPNLSVRLRELAIRAGLMASPGCAPHRAGADPRVGPRDG